MLKFIIIIIALTVTINFMLFLENKKAENDIMKKDVKKDEEKEKLNTGNNADNINHSLDLVK